MLKSGEEQEEDLEKQRAAVVELRELEKQCICGKDANARRRQQNILF